MGAKKKEQTRWLRDREKERYWSTHLANWQKSGLSVRAYCQEHGVIETSFYAWRRELMLRAREKGESSADVVPIVKDQRGRSIPARFRESVPEKNKSVESNNPFVELNVLEDDEPVASSPTLDKKPMPEVSLAITITTPKGYSISLNRASDLDYLAVVLKAMEEDNQC